MTVIKTVKVMLCPNNKQRTKLFKSAGTARFAYNCALGYQQMNYDIGNDFMSDCDLRKVLTSLKTTDKLNWLNDYSNNITKQAIKDACNAFMNFFKGKSKYPKFKSKKKSRPSFYVDNVKIKFTETHVKLEKLTSSKKDNKQRFNWIRLGEHDRIPIDCRYSNPRVTFDGLNWWISVGIEYDESQEQPTNDGIGIDIGIKDLAVCSDGNKYKNINKSSKVKKLKKKKRRLQRKVSRKHMKNKKGNNYCKTSNIIKSEKQLLKVNHQLTNIRHNYLNQATSEIVNRKPKFIVLEDLNVKGMMKNKHITSDRYFPSSKTCCKCGSVKSNLKLSDRVYICTECGNIIDRDYQAALNLAEYGKKLIV